MTAKRFRRGLVSDSFVIDILERYRPEAVILRRFRYGPAVTEYLSGRYQTLRSEGKLRFMIRRDLDVMPAGNRP
jgi:hypothetical protein